MTESAAQSDALSTTFMIMPFEDIIEFCRSNYFVAGMVVKNDVTQVGDEDVFISNNFIGTNYFQKT